MLSRRTLRIKMMQQLLALQTQNTLLFQPSSQGDHQQDDAIIDALLKELAEDLHTAQEWPLRWLMLLLRWEEVDASHAALKIVPQKTTLAHNSLLAALAKQKQFMKYTHKIPWRWNEQLTKQWYHQFKTRDFFVKYTTRAGHTAARDAQFVIDLVKKVICKSKEIDAYAYAKDIRWHENSALAKRLLLESLEKLQRGEKESFAFYKDALDDEKVHYKQVLTPVVAKRDIIIAEIVAYLKGWVWGRVAELDRVILMMGVAELTFVPETETAIVVSEYVALAKQYSTAKSAGFVNGLLDAYAKDRK
jgi:N utilization substance protein B